MSSTREKEMIREGGQMQSFQTSITPKESTEDLGKSSDSLRELTNNNSINSIKAAKLATNSGEFKQRQIVETPTKLSDSISEINATLDVSISSSIDPELLSALKAVSEEVEHQGEIDDTWKKIFEYGSHDVHVDIGETYLNRWRGQPFDDQEFLTLTSMLKCEHPVVSFSTERRINMLLEVVGKGYLASLHDVNGIRLTADVSIDRLAISFEDIPFAQAYKLQLCSNKTKLDASIQMSVRPVSIELGDVIIRYSFTFIPYRKGVERKVLPLRSILLKTTKDILHVELDATCLLQSVTFQDCDCFARFGHVEICLLQKRNYFTVLLDPSVKELVFSFYTSNSSTIAQTALPLFNSDGELIPDGEHERKVSSSTISCSVIFRTFAHVRPPLYQKQIYSRYLGDQDSFLANLIETFHNSTDVLFKSNYSATERYQWIRITTMKIIHSIERYNVYENIDTKQVLRKSIFNFVTNLLRFILTSESHHFEIYTLLLRKRFDRLFLESYVDYQIREVHFANKRHDYEKFTSLLTIVAYATHIAKGGLSISIAILKMANVLLQRVTNAEIFPDMDLKRRLQLLVTIVTLAIPNKLNDCQLQELLKFVKNIGAVIKNSSVSEVEVPISIFVGHILKFYGEAVKSECSELILELLVRNSSNQDLLRPLWNLFQLSFDHNLQSIFERMLHRVESDLPYQLICAQFISKFRPALAWKYLGSISNSSSAIVQQSMSAISPNLLFPVIKNILSGNVDEFLVQDVLRLHVTYHSNEIMRAIIKFAVWSLIIQQNPTYLMKSMVSAVISNNFKVAQFESCSSHSLHNAVNNLLSRSVQMSYFNTVKFFEVEQLLQSIAREASTIGFVELVPTGFKAWLNLPPIKSTLETVLSLHILLNRFLTIKDMETVMILLQLLTRIHTSNMDSIRVAGTLLLLAAIEFGYDDLPAAFEWISEIQSGKSEAILDTVEDVLIRKLSENADQDLSNLIECAEIIDYASDIIESRDQVVADILRTQAIMLHKRLCTPDMREKVRSLYYRKMMLYSHRAIQPSFGAFFYVELLCPHGNNLPALCNESEYVVEFSCYFELVEEFQRILPAVKVILPRQIIPPFDQVDVSYVRILPAIRESRSIFKVFDYSFEQRVPFMPQCISRILKINEVGLYTRCLAPVLSQTNTTITEAEANCEWFNYLLDVDNIEQICDALREELDFVLGLKHSIMLLNCYDSMMDEARKEKFAEMKRAWVKEKILAESKGGSVPPMPEITKLEIDPCIARLRDRLRQFIHHAQSVPNPSAELQLLLAPLISIIL